VYRRAFPGITHQQYLDESTYAETQWMTHLHRIHEQIRRENEDAAASKAGV